MKPLLLFILKKILPRATRNQRLKQLGQYRGSSLGLFKQSAYCIVAAYGYLSVRSFNKYLIAGELAVIIFCFAAFTGPTALFTIIAAILTTLAFRNAYLHHEFLALAEKPPARSRYYIDRGGDAVTMMVVLLGTQTLALHYAPSVVLPGPDLIRGMAICAPLIGILRASLRPEPPQEPERQMSQRSAMHIYIRTCVFNVLWMLSVYGLILQDVTDDPNSMLDRFRGGLPLVTAGFIVIAGRNGLIRRDTLITLRTSPPKAETGAAEGDSAAARQAGPTGLLAVHHIRIHAVCRTGRVHGRRSLALAFGAGRWGQPP